MVMTSPPEEDRPAALREGALSLGEVLGAEEGELGGALGGHRVVESGRQRRQELLRRAKGERRQPGESLGDPRACSRAVPAATRSSTRPQPWATSAGTVLAVRSSCLARDQPTRRVSAQVAPASAVRPTLAKEAQKRASCAATTTSQAAATARPAPKAPLRPRRRRARALGDRPGHRLHRDHPPPGDLQVGRHRRDVAAGAEDRARPGEDDCSDVIGGGGLGERVGEGHPLLHPQGVPTLGAVEHEDAHAAVLLDSDRVCGTHRVDAPRIICLAMIVRWISLVPS